MKLIINYAILKNAGSIFWRFFILTNYVQIFTLILILFESINLAAPATAAPFIENTKTIEVRLRYKTIFELDLTENQSHLKTDNNNEEISFSIEKNNNFLKDCIYNNNDLFLFGTFSPVLIKNENNSFNKFETILQKIKNIGFSSFIINSADFFQDKIIAGASNGNLIEITPTGASIILISSFRGRFPISKIKNYNEHSFICTEGNGIYIYTQNKIYRISEESHKIISNFVNDIFIFETNGLKYAAVFSMNGVSILKINDILSNNYETAMNFKTPSSVECGTYFNEGIYFGGAFGIYKIACEENFKLIPLKKDFYVRSIQISEDKNYAVAATMASGIWKLKKDEAFEKYLSLQELEKSALLDQVKSAFELNGVLCIVHKKGIIKYSGNRIRDIFSLESGYSDKISALADYKKYIAIGTFDKGVYLKDEACNLKNISDICNNYDYPRHINTLSEFKNLLFIGTTAGLFTFDDKSKQIKLFELKISREKAKNDNLKNYKSSNTKTEILKKDDLNIVENEQQNKPAGINCIHLSYNKAFIGTSNGIFIIDERLNVTHIPLDPEIIDKHVYSIYYNRHAGLIYAGTYRGFAEISLKDFSLKTYFMINSNLPDNWITAITPVNDSNLLIGTYDKGMTIFNMDKKIFTRAIITGKKITLSNMINMNALFNYKNYIFAGTYNGGFSIINTYGNSDPSNWNARHFTQHNGLCGDMVTSFIKHNGNFYLSTFSGIASFNESNISEYFNKR